MSHSAQSFSFVLGFWPYLIEPPPNLPGKALRCFGPSKPVLMPKLSGKKSRVVYYRNMKNRLVMAPTVLLIGATILNAIVGWSSPAEAVLPVNDESIAGAPTPPTSVKEDRVWDFPKGAGWEKRFFEKPLSAYSSYNVTKNQFRSPGGSRIPLKSPGMLPGIEFGVEMNSFQALQSVVPPQSFSNSFNFQQNQPLLLAPSNISPDYNAGFLRFTW